MSEHKGFTLIEVLVAIAIFITVILIPVSVITAYLRSSALTENSVKANFLSQQIIEEIREKRDTDIISGNGNWFNTLYDSSTEIGKCVVSRQDWLDNKYSTHCTVSKNSDGIISIDQNGTKANVNENTCDGNNTSSGNIFTSIFSVVVPVLDDGAKYATIRTCVSWLNKLGDVRKIEHTETLFEWLRR